MRSLAVILFLLIVLGFIGCASPEQGAMGNVGATGPRGTPGQDGINGTSVTVVKLCPGQTVYPTTFVEVAFCISGILYGTYSLNGGFSTELPPGNYSSNALGSRCDLTVHANCVVSH